MRDRLIDWFKLSIRLGLSRLTSSTRIDPSQPASHRSSCWCGSTTINPGASIELEGAESYRIEFCKGCGAGRLEPSPDDGRLALAYDADYYGQSTRKFVGPVARGVALFQSGRARSVSGYVWPEGRILDVGCGNGGFLAQMKSLGYDVTGTEWTQRSASRVDASLGVPVLAGDLLDLGLPHESFDAVTLWHVLEHVRDPFATLNEVRRLLRPEGRLFLAMPNVESWQAKMFEGAWFHLDPPRHLFHFGPKSIGVLLNRTGFRLDWLSTFSMEQNPFGFIQSSLNALGLPRDQAYHVLKGGNASFVVKFSSLAAIAALSGPALAESLVASVFGSGATMSLRAGVVR